MKQSQLAINSVSTKHRDIVEALSAYREAGFRNVEFCLPHVWDYIKASHTPQDVKKLLDQNGQTCIGGFESGVICFGTPEEREKNHARVAENCQLLATLGAKVQVVGTDGPADVSKVPDVIGEYAKAFADLSKRIEPTGVTICIEFNWSPLVKSLRTAAEIARRSGAKNIGVLFDPAHYHCTPTKFDQLTPGNIRTIKHVHVDDMKDKPAELSNCNADRALPGQGHLDLKSIFGTIEKHGYNGYFSIEMFSDELWSMPCEKAAKLMYQSMLPLCEG
jgi:4-hydroxyphenylpyruvate dioxygenase